MSGRHQPLNGADSAASLRDSMVCSGCDKATEPLNDEYVCDDCAERNAEMWERVLT